MVHIKESGNYQNRDLINNLVIFDVDGTLTDTMDIDTACFAETIYELYPGITINTNWESYQNSTDTGFLLEIFNTHFSREPTKEELNQIQTCFFNRLTSVFYQQSITCTPLKGALTIFEKLKAINWQVAIATGCWQQSALLKLKAAKISHNYIPMGHGGDGFRREDIIHSAVEKAKKAYKVQDYQNIVYIGDRNWDKKAAYDAGVEFIGIGSVFSNTGIDYIENYESELLLKYLREKERSYCIN
jgi:phosphoglycolate phosphatase-like HAD superfamily hydrolase